MKNTLLALRFLALVIGIASFGIYLDKKMDGIDNALYEHMKEEHNNKFRAKKENA